MRHREKEIPPEIDNYILRDLIERYVRDEKGRKILTLHLTYNCPLSIIAHEVGMSERGTKYAYYRCFEELLPHIKIPG